MAEFSGHPKCRGENEGCSIGQGEWRQSPESMWRKVTVGLDWGDGGASDYVEFRVRMIESRGAIDTLRHTRGRGS